jgi:hypothetical protein
VRRFGLWRHAYARADSASRGAPRPSLQKNQDRRVEYFLKKKKSFVTLKPRYILDFPQHRATSVNS